MAHRAGIGLLDAVNRPGPLAKLIFGLIEGVLTLVGFIAVITPLALWTVPQVDDFSVIIYYIVFSIGVAAFLDEDLSLLQCVAYFHVQ